MALHKLRIQILSVTVFLLPAWCLAFDAGDIASGMNIADVSRILKNKGYKLEESPILPSFTAIGIAEYSYTPDKGRFVAGGLKFCDGRLISHLIEKTPSLAEFNKLSLQISEKLSLPKKEKVVFSEGPVTVNADVHRWKSQSSEITLTHSKLSGLRALGENEKVTLQISEENLCLNRIRKRP